MVFIENPVNTCASERRETNESKLATLHPRTSDRARIATWN